jgi:Asp-tRNA(Asn)/Glu-tRNA(Gln) amidotransferase C subunit
MNQAAGGTAHEEKVRNDAASNEQFRSIWENALKEYKAETGHDLQSFKSVHNINDLSRSMRAMEDGFAKTRKGDSGYQKTRDLLKSCVLPLQAASSLAAGALGMTPFAPAATIFGAGMYLIDACDSVSKAYDFVTELLEECKTYVDRLKKLSEIEMQKDFVLKLTAILKFILEVFAECEKVMTRGRGKIWADKAFLGKGKDEILQSSLERLKRYFTEEEMYTVAQIYVTTEKTSTNVFKLVDFNKTSQVQRVVDSLPRGPFDVAAKQVEDNEKSSVLPPVWVEEMEAYQEWIRNTSPQCRWLWGLGSVGVGKTTLVSYLATKMILQGPSFITPNMRPTLVNAGLNDLSSRYSLPQTAVAVFYGDYETKGDQRPDLVFQCLICQLLQQLQVAAIDRAVIRSQQIDDLKKANTASSLVSWSSILNDLASEFQRTFIFVDALDKEESGYEDLVARLHQLKSPSLKLFVTSRDDQSMRNDAEHRKAIIMMISADQKIMTDYVHNRLERIRDHAETTETMSVSALPSFLHNQSDFEHVLKTIMSTAQDNFYYAETSINLLLQERKLENLRHKMTKLTGNLSQVIRLDVERVEQQSDQYNRKVGLKTLMLAAFAGRPLTIPEIQNMVVLFVHPATRESARQLAFKVQFFSIEYLVECSCRLLRVDERNGIVHVDEAIKSYCTRSGMFDTAHYEIAEICLTFLDRMSFQLRCRNKEEHDLRRQEFPLYLYAARYWAFHMREAGESLFLNISAPVPLYTLLNRKLFCDAIASALHEDLPPQLWNWAGQDTWQVMKVSKSPTLPAVHLLAYLNLPLTFDWWLRKNPDDIHAKTATGITPLYLACLLGHTRIVESLLFDYHADPSAKGSPPSNDCLHAAINSQSTEIVERILYVSSKESLGLSTGAHSEATQ